MTKWFRNLFLAIMAAGLFIGMASEGAWAKNPKNVIFVIGDSLSDPGNLFALTGFWPPSPPYAQRNCNGPVWTEYLSADLSIPVDSRAFGGALSGVFLLEGVPVSNFNSVQNPPAIPGLPGVSEEIDALLAEYPEGLNPSALYVIWAGPNDFFLGLVQQGMMEQILAKTVENIADSVCKLGTAGARHFAVGNMSDIALTPFARDLGPDAQALFSQTIAQFNAGLEQALANLPVSCAETMEILDTARILQDISEDPEAFTLTNVTDACLTFPVGLPPVVCANPDEYLFWDSVHPTTAVQAIFADKFRSAFCGTGEATPGLRGRPAGMPPAAWRGVCYGSR
jgi:outer membrane lipase/esterase